jgi:methylmalonyl-CoA mutase
MADDHQDERPNFLDEFPAPDLVEWQTAAVASLGGKPFDKLVTPSYEGIAIQPMYRREDTAAIATQDDLPGQPSFIRGTTAAGYIRQPWAIAQELAQSTPAAFNRALQFDLEHGQTAVNLLLDGPTRAGKDPDQAKSGEVGQGGVSLATVEDLAVALSGVDLATTPLFIRAGTVALPLLALLIAHFKRQGRPITDLHGCLEDDPLGVLAHEGTLPLSLERAFDEMAHLTAWAAANAPRLATVAVHTYPYHNAGANAVQELAFGLATGVAYLRALADRGVDIAKTAPRVRFDYAIGGNFFMEVAKLRAARWLWSQAVVAFGGDMDAQRLRIHARTSRRNKTAVDPYVNMLRVTTEALAAAVGGADSLHVAPFDEPIRLADEFSRRIARNVQIVLQKEAHMTEVIDPAGGSYAVEELTDQLAKHAWELFQEVERRGGMAAALQSGFIQAQIAEVAQKRAANLAKRRDIMVGTNQYANPAEIPLPVDPVDLEVVYRERAEQMARYRTHDDNPAAHMAALDRLAKMLDAPPEQMVATAIDAAAAGATLNEITRTLRLRDETRPTIVPVKLGRAAAPFEALRRTADDYAATHGIRPRIFLANMGPARQHKARADFSQGFFEVGGFQVLTNNGFPTPEAAAEAAIASGAPAVVICSTDETYPDIVPPLVGAIKKHSTATAVLLAGKPAEQMEAHRSAGVDEFIYFGADCLALNKWLLERIR